MKKLSFLFVLSILLVSTLLIAPSVSAWTSDRFVEDTQKIDDKSLELEKETTTKYGTYEIIDHKWWDVLKIWTEEKIKEVRLEENTDVCSNDCLAIKEITNLKPAPLIEDVRFLRDFGDGKFVAWNGFTNYRVLVEEDVEQFETICKDGKEIIDEKNGTKYFEQDCSQVSIGFVKQWLPLDMKKDYEGTYKVKLEGGKKESTILDWQVKINGYWTTEWAVWGNISQVVHTNCYQESANTTNQTGIDGDCGLNYNGIISSTGSSINNLVDGSWNTQLSYASVINTNITYIPPIGNYTAVWRIGSANFFGDLVDTNVTIPTLCLGTTLKLNINTSADPNGESRWNCFDSSNNLINVFSSTGGANLGMIYEEAIYWNIYPNAYVTLNSPANGATALTNSVTFNASANVTGGAYLTNMSFCSNLTGSWGCGDSVNFFTSLIEAHGQTTSTTSSWSNRAGRTIKSNYNQNLINITKHSSSTATRALVYHQNGTLIGTASFVGDTAIFSTPIRMLANNHYLVEADNSGSSYTRTYRDGGTATSPINSVYINWVNDSVDETTYVGGYYYNILSVGLNQIETSSTQTWSKTIPAGTTLWNVQACDTDGDCGFSVANYTVSLDATAPTISINSGNGTQNYGSLTQNHTINFTATDTNLDKVLFNYNGTNRTITGATSGVMNSTSFALVLGLYNGTLWANDTAGNVQSQVVSWNYKVFEINRSFAPTTITTTNNQFTVNVTTATASIPVAYLVYNGTEYLTTRTGTTTNHLFSRNLTINTNGTYEFYWKIVYDEEDYTTYASNQTVTGVTSAVIQAGACPAGLTRVMYWSFADETNLSTITNTTVRYNFQYGISDSTGATSFGTLTNVADASLCLNTTQSATYDIGYGELDYEKEGYTARRFYVFSNTRVSNATINTTLYSLPDASSTSFLVELRSPTLSPYVGYYTSLLRWYPSANEYKVVEMGKTDDKGQTVKKIKIEDVDYRIGLYETDGTLVYLANPIRMVCLATPCSYSINVPTDATDAFEEVQGIEVDLSYTAGVFTLVYNDPSQNTEIMSLRVYKMGGTSERVVCESNGTSFTGILTCDVSSETGTLRAIAIRTASPERPLALLIIDTLTTVFTGTFGLFIQFLIIVTLAFLGIVSPVVAIIMALISLLLGVLVFKTFSYALLIGVALLGGIVIHLMKRSAGQ
jgi:hypothetical protein